MMDQDISDNVFCFIFILVAIACKPLCFLIVSFYSGE